MPVGIRQFVLRYVHKIDKFRGRGDLGNFMNNNA
jgi:hypothetical protein